MRIGLPGLGDRSFKVEGDVFPMSATKLLNTFALCLAVVAIGLVGFKNYQGDQNGQLLNVSYDPAREVYKATPNSSRSIRRKPGTNCVSSNLMAVRRGKPGRLRRGWPPMS
jgi:hypothetical protein